MSAVATAERVLLWAQSGQGSIPPGDLSDTEELADPGQGLLARTAAQQLAAVAAARWRWGCPPLGDRRALGPGVLILAAAMGGGSNGHLEAARLLAQAIPQIDHNGAAAELLTRHFVLDRACGRLPAQLAEELLLCSPLTELLDGPVASRKTAATRLAQRLLNNRLGKSFLCLRLAQPDLPRSSRRWHAELLERLRIGSDAEYAFVIDVYESQFVHHREATLQEIRSASAAILAASRVDDDDEVRRLDAAISLAKWWGPLWAIHRGDVDAIRYRSYLSFEFLEGLKLFEMVRGVPGGVA